MVLIEQYFNDNAKFFIIDVYVNKNFQLEELVGRDLIPIIQEFSKTFKDDTEYTIVGYMSKIMKISHADIIKAIQTRQHIDIVFDHIKNTDFVKDMLANAKVVYVELDPSTGKTKPVTIH